jgi:rhodanese-like protein
MLSYFPGDRTPVTIPRLLHPADLVRLRAESPRIRILDVRTPGEFETQHIAGAYNVPLDTLPEHGAEIRANVTDPIVLVRALASGGAPTGARVRNEPNNACPAC